MNYKDRNNFIRHHQHQITVKNDPTNTIMQVAENRDEMMQANSNPVDPVEAQVDQHILRSKVYAFF